LFEEVIQLLCETTSRTKEEASNIAHRIDELGREIVDMNTNVSRLLEIAQTISHVDLGVTIRRAYDTFREQVAAVVIEWLLDLTRSRLETDELILREVIAAEFLAPEGLLNSHAISVIAGVRDPTRLDVFVPYETMEETAFELEGDLRVGADAKPGA